MGSLSFSEGTSEIRANKMLLKWTTNWVGSASLISFYKVLKIKNNENTHQLSKRGRKFLRSKKDHRESHRKKS